MDTLVQNLLKLARLDAGAIVLEKRPEQVADMMKNVQLHFAYRARQEGKQLLLSGADEVSLLCDQDWMLEAVDNIVKNALDHTQRGIPSDRLAAVCLYGADHRNRQRRRHPPGGFTPHFQAVLPQPVFPGYPGPWSGPSPAKGILEAHNGAIEVRSELGAGTTFVISFLIPTKL